MASNKDIKEWALATGRAVPPRGPLPNQLLADYQAAHPGPDPAPPPDDDDDDGYPDTLPPPPPEKEQKPRNVEVRKPGKALDLLKRRAGSGGPRHSKHKPRHARVPVDDTIAAVWRGLAALARPLPATSLMLKIEAPIAGALLEDTVKGTIIDTILQPVARLKGQGETGAALILPPACVTAIQLRPDLLPLLAPVLRESLVMMYRVGGPKMAQAMAADAKAEQDYGQSVDQLMNLLLSAMVAPEEGQAAMSEDEVVRQAQQQMSDAAA